MNVRGRRFLRSRRGATLILSLVVLILVTALVGSMAAAIVNAHKRSRIGRLNAQVACLADAAVSRAVARLARDPAYSGETWEIPADQLDGDGHARLTIVVAREVGDRPDYPTVQVRAELVGRLSLFARSSRKVNVRVGRSPTGATP